MIARRPSSLSTAFEEFESAASKIGLLVNENKQNTLSVYQKREIHLINYDFEKTETFKYLDSLATADNNISTEIQARLRAGNRCYYALQNVLKGKSLSQKAKLNVCNK
jgi:hypothetical protein